MTSTESVWGLKCPLWCSHCWCIKKLLKNFHNNIKVQIVSSSFLSLQPEPLFIYVVNSGVAAEEVQDSICGLQYQLWHGPI